jgi:type VI secretion system protein ImpC
LAPKIFPNTKEGKEAELNFKLSTQFPYMMIMDRLAHYVKVMQRENIGTWKDRAELEGELNKWLSQYVTEMDNPDAVTRSKRPLRAASIKVSDVEGDPGWYSVTITAQPHFKYMGANFTLSLSGKLDKA